MKKEKIYEKAWYVYLAVIMAVVMYTIVSFGRPHTWAGFNSGVCYALSEGWSFQQGGQSAQQVSLPMKVCFSKESPQAIISRRLPEQIPVGWYLEIPAPLDLVQVYIDQTRVLDYKGPEGFLASGMPANEKLFVKLQKEDGGKELTIIFKSPMQPYNGSIGNIYIGDHTDIIYHMVSSTWTALTGGLILVIVGVILLILRIFMKTWVTHRNDYFFMGVYILLIGLWFLLQSGMTQLIFQDVALARAAEFFALLSIPIPVIRHIDSVTLQIHHMAAQILSFVSIVCMVLVFTLVYYKRRDFLEVNWINLLVLCATVLYVMVTFIRVRLTDPVLFNELRWLVYANFFLGAGTVLEIADAAFDSYSHVGSFMLPAVVIYCGCAFKWGMLQIRKDEIEKEKVNRQTSAKSEFLANMSHEIRTPVNAILGINDMLRSESTELSVISYADDIEYSARELLSLINKILDSSKLESGKMTLTKADYAVALLIDDLNEEAERYFKPGVKYILKNNPELPSVLYGDEPKICSMVTHVMENAFKYTDEGAVIVSLNFRMKENGDLILIIRVRDTGRGLPEDDQTDIFSQFKRPGYEAQGAGLGLSISWNLARMMNGTITAESADGIGSLFSIEILQEVSSPAPLGIYRPDDREEKSVEDTENGSAEVVNCHILIVDDEPMNLKIACNVLQDTGMRIDTAKDGQEALQKTIQTAYDMILMDHLMPGMSGEDTFRRIRQESSLNRYTPVVILTAEDSEEYRRSIREQGLSGYILKPVTLPAVMEALLQAGVRGGAKR